MSTYEDKQRAHALRKASRLKEALALYQKLWSDSEHRDGYMAAGYLHCLRKLGNKGEALKFADQFFEELKPMPWGKSEIIWTYVKFFFQAEEKAGQDIETISATAARLMGLNPEALQKEIIVMKVIKTAKDCKRWDLVNEWTLRIEPEALDLDPREFNGKKTWPQRAVWYNCRINGLLDSDDPADLEQALQLSEEAAALFAPQRKIFCRLAARANDLLGNANQASLIYKELCADPRVEWWILYDYAKLLKKTGNNGEAIALMCRAALSCPKTDKLVNLLYDLVLLFRDERDPGEAKAHLLLCRYVREQQNWKVSHDMLSLLQHLDRQSVSMQLDSLGEALAHCKKTWNRLGGKQGKPQQPASATGRAHEDGDFHRPKRGLQGRVKDTAEERPYCFIIGDNQESYFCIKADLPPGTEDGHAVVFDAVPSFNRKKNTPSWKAANIREAF